MKKKVKQQIPKRLKREPLIEVIWQGVFEPEIQDIPCDALLGLVFSALQQSGGSWRIQRLPTADIPAAIAGQDPNLRYSVKFRIESPNIPILYQIGDRVVTVNARKPYVGWSNFRNKIIWLQDTLRKVGVQTGPDRHSLRYLDVIAPEFMSGLDGLLIDLKVGDQHISQQPIQFRLETQYYDHQHILHIVHPATVHSQEGERKGVLIDLETLAQCDKDWGQAKNQLEGLHDASKAMFFYQVLKKGLVNKLDPEY